MHLRLESQPSSIFRTCVEGFFQRLLGFVYTYASDMLCSFAYGSSGASCMSSGAVFVCIFQNFVAEMWCSNRSGFHKHVSVLMTRTVCPQDHIALLQVLRINTIIRSPYCCTYLCPLPLIPLLPIVTHPPSPSISLSPSPFSLSPPSHIP